MRRYGTSNDCLRSPDRYNFTIEFRFASIMLIAAPSSRLPQLSGLFHITTVAIFTSRRRSTSHHSCDPFCVWTELGHGVLLSVSPFTGISVLLSPGWGNCCSMHSARSNRVLLDVAVPSSSKGLEASPTPKTCSS